MKKIEIKNENEIGENKIITEFEKLDEFVLSNFDKLMIGAYRSENFFARQEDCYTSAERIYSANYDELGIRLHSYEGIKQITSENNKYYYKENALEELTEELVIYAAKKIQELIDAAEQEVECSFKIEVIEAAA